jgi:hypothetical protein
LQQGYALKDLRWPEDCPETGSCTGSDRSGNNRHKNAAVPDITPQQQALLATTGSLAQSVAVPVPDWRGNWVNTVAAQPYPH